MATMRDYSDRMGDVLKRWGTNPTAALPGPAEAPLPPIQPQTAPAAETIRATGPTLSKEAQAFQSQRASQMGPQRPAGWTPPNAAPSKMAQAFGSADEWKTWAGNAGRSASEAAKNTGTLQPAAGVQGTLGKLAAGAMRKAGPIAGMYEGVTGALEGDTNKFGWGVADTGAALAMGSPLAPVAGTYLAGRGLYEGGKLAAGAISDSLGERGRDAVGGTVNGLLRRVGLGVNDDAMMELNAQAGGQPTSLRTAAPGPAAPVAPTITPPAGTSRFASNPNPFGSAPVAAQPAAPAAPAPQPFAGSISKTMRNPDGSAGRTTTVGTPDPLAHTMADPGLKYVPIQLDDGTVLDGRTQARMAAQQVAARANEDPIQRGMRQQLEHNQAIMAQAEQLAGSNPDGRSGRIAAYMNQLGGRGSDLVGQNVAMRGQDVTDRGHTLTARTAAASAQAAKAQQDRVYNLDVQRFGVEVAEKNRTASAASAAALQSSLESKYRKTDKDGKSVPDSDKIAQFRTMVDATLPEMIKELEATGNPDALAKAKQMRERGPAALEPGDYNDLQSLYDFRDRAEQSAGVLPGSGTFKKSNNLLDYRQNKKGGVEKTFIGGDRVVTPASSTSIRDFQYEGGPANAILPDWGKTQTLDLTRKLRGFQ